MQERLTEIEIKLAHAEAALMDLSDVVYAQQAALQRLNRQLQELGERLADQAATQPETSPDEKPPHY